MLVVYLGILFNSFSLRRNELDIKQGVKCILKYPKFSYLLPLLPLIIQNLLDSSPCFYFSYHSYFPRSSQSDFLRFNPTTFPIKKILNDFLLYFKLVQSPFMTCKALSFSLLCFHFSKQHFGYGELLLLFFVHLLSGYFQRRLNHL